MFSTRKEVFAAPYTFSQRLDIGGGVEAVFSGRSRMVPIIFSFPRVFLTVRFPLGCELFAPIRKLQARIWFKCVVRILIPSSAAYLFKSSSVGLEECMISLLK